MTTPASPEHQGQHPAPGPDHRTERAPEHLLGAEPVDICWQAGPQLASAHRVGATHHPLHDLAEVTDDRPQHDPDGASGGRRPSSSSREGSGVSRR